MSIQWNKVTWYSKLAAIILFVATFWLAFCLGRQYEAAQSGERQGSYKMPFNR